MPLVRIDVIEGRTSEQLRTVEVFAAPEREPVPSDDCARHTARDRAQRGVVVVQITAQGRDQAQRISLHPRLAELPAERDVARGADLVVSAIENTQGAWSFGFGRAQFLAGS